MDNSIEYISLSELVPGEFHPHQENIPDNLDNLTNSIKNYGILVPLIVRPKDKNYEIILGNRRYKVAKSLGLEKVPVIVSNVDDKKALELIISDNIQRKELTSKEEASLYDKALSFPNTNTEKLSMNLGIPLDRITSKLNLLRKEKKVIPEEHIQENSNNYDKKNNSINNDVINLSELNQKEKERDDYIMNNNQFINNNLNENQTNNSPIDSTPNQEPTFGGRFFPSLEDEPTNMNLNNNFPNSIIDPTPSPLSTGINTPPNSEPLIDLTDLSSISQNNQAPLASAQSININQPTASPNISESIPSPEVPLNTSSPEINPAQYNDPNLTMSNNQPINNNLNQSIGEQISPIDISNLPPMNNSIPEQPIADNNINIPNLTNSDIATPEPVANMNNNVDSNINPIPTPPISPSELSTTNINNIPNPNNEINIDNQMATPININQDIPLSINKDIIPVVNMIKNLAISIESLGYKLNITEADEISSYKITIEVEK